MMAKIILLIVSFLLVILTSVPAMSETYIYARRYYISRTNVGATTDLLSAPTLKTEYGVLTHNDLKWGLYLDVDFILRSSIQGTTDPPESFKVDVRVGKMIGSWDFSVGHGRFHNISRGDPRTKKGFGLYQLYVEVGRYF